MSKLKECLIEGYQENMNIEEMMISLNRLSMLIDLFHYYPLFRKYKTNLDKSIYRQDRNASSELYMVLSSNKQVKAYDPQVWQNSTIRSQS